MDKLIPVKAPTPIPPAPPTRKEKRRKNTDPAPQNSGDGQPQVDDKPVSKNDEDNQSLDEYA
ncbi:MAG: hypothetical protein HKM98_09730 [Gammaproteobacteria bacterium]|nr:hypothetical protein [Gammaproteobacteria bacterium]